MAVVVVVIVAVLAAASGSSTAWCVVGFGDLGFTRFSLHDLCLKFWRLVHM